jgi:hypothetical protein
MRRGGNTLKRYQKEIEFVSIGNRNFIHSPSPRRNHKRRAHLSTKEHKNSLGSMLRQARCQTMTVLSVLILNYPKAPSLILNIKLGER